MIKRLNKYFDDLEQRSSVDKADLLAEIDKLKNANKSSKRSCNDENDNSQFKQLSHRFNAKDKELVQASEKIDKLNDAFKNYCAFS